MPKLFSIVFMILLLAGCAGKNIPEGEKYLSPLPVQHILVGDVQLGYRSFGQGEPLLMVMGFAGTMDLWDAQFIRELAKKHTVIIFDNRGTGASTAGTRQITLGRMAEDAVGLLHGLGYEKAHVLGWSMGGMIAQEMAVYHSAAVDKLILMGTSCDRDSVAEITHRLLRMNTEELISHFFPSGWLEKYPGAIADLPRPATAPEPEIIKAQAQAMINWAGTCSMLYALQNDTLIISGTSDDILPGSLSMELAQKIDGSWLVRYKNATHWLMYQDPVSLGIAVDTFLQVQENMFKR